MAVFSIAGRQDEFGFANVEAQLPALEKTLGRENVSVKIIDGLGHGFGIGSETKVKTGFRKQLSFGKRTDNSEMRKTVWARFMLQKPITSQTL